MFDYAVGTAQIAAVGIGQRQHFVVPGLKFIQSAAFRIHATIHKKPTLISGRVFCGGRDTLGSLTYSWAVLHFEAHTHTVHAPKDVIVVERSRDCLPGVIAGARIKDGGIYIKQVFDIEVRIDAGAHAVAATEVEIPGAGECVEVGGDVVGGGDRTSRGASDPV